MAAFNEPVLVLCATSKTGKNVTRALKDGGFSSVFGTTRNAKNSLAQRGITPIVASYVDRADLERALRESGAKKAGACTASLFGSSASRFLPG